MEHEGIWPFRESAAATIMMGQEEPVAKTLSPKQEEASTFFFLPPPIRTTTMPLDNPTKNNTQIQYYFLLPNIKVSFWTS
jgi:hypothetical protein